MSGDNCSVVVMITATPAAGEPPPPYEAEGAAASTEDAAGGADTAVGADTAGGVDTAGGADTAGGTSKRHDSGTAGQEPPPTYADATNPTKLPSYAEVEQLKTREVDGANTDDAPLDAGQALRLWRISTLGLDPEAAASLQEQQMLGTDLMFFVAFLMAFLFNWIGFLLLLCFCHSVAGRYGALAGFGLSLAKWTLIVKNSTHIVSHGNTWLWWLIMAFGLVISVRAVLQYLYIKREWHQLPDTTRRRLIFFY